MSADNWTVCPKCNAKAIAQKDEQIMTARNSYGKVPPDEYERLRVEALKEIEVDLSFREDYEIGVTADGEFFVVYTGGCRECGFHHEFKHDQNLMTHPGSTGKPERV